MKLLDYSIDDLHIMSVAEFEDWPEAVEVLEDLYRRQTFETCEWIQALREVSRDGRP